MILIIHILTVGQIGHIPGESIPQTASIRLRALEEVRPTVFSEIEVQHTNLTSRSILHISQTPQIIQGPGI